MSDKIINLEEAFEIRQRIVSLGRDPLRSVIESVLYGRYDRYKEDAINIAIEDVSFLKDTLNKAKLLTGEFE